MLAMMEPHASMEEEFQDWYDSEHFPERATTDGFQTATRAVCIDGWPRYIAIYDLADVDVLDGPEYGKFARENYSQWTAPDHLPCVRVTTGRSADRPTRERR